MLTIFVSAQQWKNNLPQDKVQKGELSFYDIQKAFNEYWEPYNVKDGYYINESGEKVKAPGWKLFRRWEWYWENRINPETGEFPVTTAWEELQKYLKENPRSKSTSGSWTSLGPNSTSGGYAGLGRLNCAGFVSGDNNSIYVGSASGGIWKTSNGGSSWTPLGDQNAVLGVSDIIVVPGTNPHIIYIATGDRDGGSMWSLSGGQNNDNNSVGVLKSIDGGATWNTTGLTFTTSQQRTTNRLLIDPVDNNILYAATSVGLYKTTNAGTNWTLLTSTHFIDLEFNPGSSATIYGSTWNGDIYRSINNGTSFTATLTTSYNRTELAVSPNNSTIVYAVIANSSEALAGVYKSTDNGATFTQVFSGSTINLLNWDCSSTTVEGQGSYDLCIAADPTNVNNIFIGGVNTWKSTNGGTAWSLTNHWTSTWGCGVSEVHADQHFLGYQNGTATLFEGNDGGFYKTSNNGSTWTHLGNGLVTSQIYRLGVAQTVSNENICGLQDNGTKAFLSGVWSDELGGDGFDCAIDYADHNILYGELYYGDLRRSTNHGSSWTTITSGLSGTGHWCTPIIIDPTTHTTIYIGKQDVFRSTNQGTSWTKISTWAGSTLRSLAVAPSNSSYIYAATQSILYRTTIGGTTWSNITGTIPVGSGYITSISVKNNDPNTAWVSLGGYNATRIFQTTNGGTNWTDISSGLPSIPVMSVIQNKQNTSQVELYAGTDAGVYVKVGSANWTLFSTGLPNVVVTDLDIYYDVIPANSRIRAATYGRGLWQSDLYSEGPPYANFSADLLTPNTGETVSFTDLSNNSPNSWAWSFDPATITYTGGTNSVSQNPQVQFNSKGPYSVSLTATNSFGSDDEIKTNYILVGTPGLWTGASTTDWNTAGNWDNLSVPQSTQNVTIPAVASNWPIFTGNFTIGSTCADLILQGASQMSVTGDLTIATGKQFSCDGNAIIQIGGSWTNNGLFTSATSTVEFTGNTTGTITGPPALNVIFYDGFETSTGWTLSGEFQRGAPGGLGGEYGNSDPSTAYSGSNVLGVDLTGLGSAPGDYENNLTDHAYQAISPTINCTGYTNVTLNFQRWLGLEEATYDHGYIDISSNNGSSWTEIWSNSSTVEESSWTLQQIDLSAWADNQMQVKIRFCLGGTDVSWRFCGWNIDELSVTGNTAGAETFFNLSINKSNAQTITNGDIDISNNLIIEPGAWFTNETGNTLNVTNNILIKADATGMGSYLDKGTTNVTGISTVQQYITSERWHLVSTPVAGATINTYFDIYLKEYDEPTNSWNYLIAPTTIPMNSGQGFAAWADDLYTGSTIVEFTGGNINNSDMVISSLDYTPASPKAGYNLIGNPFPCAMDWNTNWPQSNLSGWAVVYDNGIYKGWHPISGGYNGKTDGIIPSSQGFWVCALNSSASLTIPLSERVHNGQDFYKDESVNVYPIIRLKATAGEYSDETVILFHPDGTDGFDGYYDLGKFYNSDEFPQFYSIAGDSEFAFNVMPSDYNNKVVPVGFEKIHEGIYQIGVTSIDNFDPGVHFYLEDILKSEYTELIEGSQISFMHNPVNDPHRFNIRITKSNLGSDELINQDIKVFSFENWVYVEMPQMNTKAEVIVYTLLGQEIYRQAGIKEQEIKINLKSCHGYCIVKVQSGEHLFTKHVYIK